MSELKFKVGDKVCVVGEVVDVDPNDERTAYALLLNGEDRWWVPTKSVQPISTLPDGFVECEESEATFAWTGRVMFTKDGSYWKVDNNLLQFIDELQPTYCKKTVELPDGWREAKPGETGIMVVREDGK